MAHAGGCAGLEGVDSKVEFTLGEVLGIAKRELHEEIIDIIKRKRQSLAEAIKPAAAEAQAKVIRFVERCEDEESEEESPVRCKQSSRQVKHVRFSKHEDNEDQEHRTYYAMDHWARATTEAGVCWRVRKASHCPVRPWIRN